MSTEKRCGTCRYFEPWSSPIGFCGWPSSDIRPIWMRGHPAMNAKNGQNCPVWQTKETDHG